MRDFRGGEQHKQRQQGRREDKKRIDFIVFTLDPCWLSMYGYVRVRSQSSSRLEPPKSIHLQTELSTGVVEHLMLRVRVLKYWCRRRRTLSEEEANDRQPRCVLGSCWLSLLFFCFVFFVSGCCRCSPTDANVDLRCRGRACPVRAKGNQAQRQRRRVKARRGCGCMCICHVVGRGFW